MAQMCADHARYTQLRQGLHLQSKHDPDTGTHLTHGAFVPQARGRAVVGLSRRKKGNVDIETPVAMGRGFYILEAQDGQGSLAVMDMRIT